MRCWMWLLLFACHREPAVVVPQAVALPDIQDAAVASISTKPPLEPHATLTMTRSGCFGSCPAYRIAVRDDGLVTWDGLMYVKHHGRVVRRVADSVARALIREFPAVAATPMKKPKGGIVVMTSDMPGFTFTLVDIDGKETKLEHDTGDSLAPDEWKAFEKRMENVLETESLISCGEAGCSR